MREIRKVTGKEEEKISKRRALKNGRDSKQWL